MIAAEEPQVMLVVSAAVIVVGVKPAVDHQLVDRLVFDQTDPIGFAVDSDSYSICLVYFLYICTQYIPPKHIHNIFTAVKRLSVGFCGVFEA